MNGNTKEKDRRYSYIYVSTCYKAIEELFSNSSDSIDKVASERVFHYTSTKVLNEILKSGEMWASDTFFLNDSREYEYGCQVLRKAFGNNFDKIISNIEAIHGRDYESVYSISFSKSSDGLQQWITYAKESGVCIGFDTQILKKEAMFRILQNVKEKDAKIEDSVTEDVKTVVATSCDSKTKTLKTKDKTKAQKNTFSRYSGHCLQSLLYGLDGVPSQDTKSINADKIKRSFTAIMKDVFQEENASIEKDLDCATLFLQLLAAYLKTADFKGENEIRAVFIPECDDEKCTKVDYYAKDNGIICPHMKVQVCNKERTIGWPITSLMIGPGGNQDIVFESVIHRIENGEVSIWKYDNVKMLNLLNEYIESFRKWNDASNTIIEDCLVSEWSKRVDKRIFKHSDELGDSYYSFEGKEGDIALPKADQKKSLDDEQRRIYENFVHSNYLSKQGILLKKSGCSYLFN